MHKRLQLDTIQNMFRKCLRCMYTILIILFKLMCLRVLYKRNIFVVFSAFVHTWNFNYFSYTFLIHKNGDDGQVIADHKTFK